MTFDDMFSKVYDEDTYNCAHFFCDTYEILTGEDVRGKFAGFLLPLSERSASYPIRAEFKRLTAPADLCVVLLLRPRSVPHIGLYLERKVFHITESGPQYQPLEIAAFGYQSVRFYQC